MVGPEGIFVARFACSHETHGFVSFLRQKPLGFRPFPRSIHSFIRKSTLRWIFHGGTGGDRTLDPRLKRPVLYQLSYSP